MDHDKIKEMLRAAGDGAYISNVDGPRAHRQVMQVAKGMCLVLYEQFAKSDSFYKTWPSAEVFAKRFWPHFCEEARATMARFIGQTQNEHLQAQAWDALIKDQSLAHTRENVVQVRMDV